MVKASDLLEKSAKALNDLVLELKRERFNLRMQISSGQGSNTARLNTVRKDIARVKTRLQQVNQEVK